MQTKAFDRIFIIIFENETVDAVRANPYMLNLESRGARLSQYFGVTHPSQPNYIASTCGAALVFDDNCQNLDATNIVDLLEAHNVSWKAYIEDLPEDKTACNVGKYFRKHNPFVTYNDIRLNPKRMERVVNAGQLQLDLAANGLPEYSWYTPNILDDGHTPQSVSDLADWLEGFLEPLLKDPKFTEGTLVVVTFDESIPYLDNHIYTTLLGDMVQAGSVQSDHWDHYSLLRTVEENFNLGTLGRFDKTADYFRFLWNAGPPQINMALHTQTVVSQVHPTPVSTNYAFSSWNPIFNGVCHAVGVATVAQGLTENCTRIQHANALQIDLQAEGVQLVTTPQFAEGFNGMTVGDVITGFLTKNPRVRVAINANFSWYQKDNSNFGVGEPYVLLGLAVSGGKVVCDPTQPGWLAGTSADGDADVPNQDYAGAMALVVNTDGAASFQLVTQQTPIDLTQVQTAVAGSAPPGPGYPPATYGAGLPVQILSNNTIQATASCTPTESVAPRTGIGLDATGRYLYLVTVDGKEHAEPAYGAAFYDLAFWLQQTGATDGINLDGGGSTAMAIATEYGPALLNTPYGDDETPGLQRAVGNFLGVIANPLSAKKGAA